MQALSMIDQFVGDDAQSENGLQTKSLFNQSVFFKYPYHNFILKVIFAAIFVSGFITFLFNFYSQPEIYYHETYHDTLKIISFLFPIFPFVLYVRNSNKDLYYHLIILSILFLVFSTAVSIKEGIPISLCWLIIIPILSYLFFTSKIALLWPIVSTGIVLGFYLQYFNSIAYHPLFLTLMTLVIITTVISQFFQKIHFYSSQLIEQKNIQIKNFLQIIGHDLATPLFIVTSNAEMALKNLQKEEKNLEGGNRELRQWSAVSRAGESMKDILNIVLDLQALEMGKIQVTPKKTDVVQVIEMSILNFSSRLKMKSIEINFKNTINPNTEIMVDPVILENQILNNVLSNAIKFSDQNSQIIINTKENDEYLVIEIHDHGLGIPKDILYNIFRWDKKTSRKGTSGESGTGFGMPLVQKFIDLFGGKIEIDSRFIEEFPDKHGTTVRIFLPNKK